MRWIIFFYLIIACFCFSTTLKVGVYHNPPLIDFSDGKISGLYAEILEQVLLQNNWKAEYIFDEFSSLLRKLKNGQIELLTAIAYTPERSEIFDFNTQAVIINWGVVCVKGTLKSLLELQNKVVAVVEGDVYGNYLRKETEKFKMDVRYFQVKDYEEAFKAVKDGLADACVVSRIFAQKHLSRYFLQMSGIVFSPVELRFAFPRGGEQAQMFIRAVDDYLYKIKSDQDKYNQLINRYLGAYVERFVIPEWVRTILVLAVFMIGLFTLWTVSLKKMVALRTGELSKTLEELDKRNEELATANEEIVAQSQQLEAMNEELQRTLTDMERAIGRFTQSMNLLDKISTFTKDDEFCWNFLDIVRSVVSDCSVIFSYKNLGYLQTRKGTKITFAFDTHELPYIFDERIYETIKIESTDDSYLILFNHSEQKITSNMIDLVKGLLNIAKVFLKVRTYQEKDRHFVRTINDVLLTILNYHESYTVKHSTRSSDYAVKIAQSLFLDDDALIRVYWAALIHDIGKIGIPREILNKTTRLSPEEFEIIKSHPVIAADLLKKAGLEDIAKIVRHHHERFDGLGYPDGLSGEQIPIESRIISVVDAYDAMTSDRPYRKALSRQRAIQELLANSGTQFDPLIVQIFVKLLNESEEE